MPLPAEFLERLRDANRIDDVMSDYVQLKRAGSQSKCLCPFHSEKTPSCTIYNDTQSFYCFGCGAGGDVITFIMKIENLSYYEAVQFLAQRSGIPMPEDTGTGDGVTRKKQRIYEMNREAARYFFENIKTPKGKTGLKYLIDRGLKPETIQRFGLGYAFDSWTGLKDHMLSKGYYENELVEAGLLGRSQHGSTFDFFKNRVIFPFFDLRGNVIAFGGRTLDPNDSRKYLNSRETLVFKKNKTLFALNFAKDKASKERRLLLCEGNMDVISMHQAGFENTVATCGTAITPEHSRLMSQYCDEVIICYDSDAAGQTASQKAINLLSQVGLRTRVIKIDGAKDPDEYIKKYGSTKFKLLIDKSEGAVIFELNKAKTGLDIENSELDRIEYLRKSYPVIADIDNRVEREVYINHLSKETNISREAITAEIESRRRKNKLSQKKKEWSEINRNTVIKKDSVNPEAAKFPRETAAEKGILSYIFSNPDRAEEISAKLSPDEFVTPLNRRIYSSLLFKIKNNADFSLSSFNSEFSPDEMGKIAEITGIRRKVSIDKQVILDYIDLLKSHTNISDKDESDWSDEDFLNYAERLKDKNRN